MSMAAVVSFNFSWLFPRQFELLLVYSYSVAQIVLGRLAPGLGFLSDILRIAEAVLSRSSSKRLLYTPVAVQNVMSSTLCCGTPRARRLNRRHESLRCSTQAWERCKQGQRWLYGWVYVAVPTALSGITAIYDILVGLQIAEQET